MGDPQGRRRRARPAPDVTFSVKDKNDQPLALSQLNRLALTIAGPTTDYTSFGRGYVQEDAMRATAAGNGVYTYTLTPLFPRTRKVRTPWASRDVE